MIGDGSAAAMAADHLAESLHAVSPDATVALAAGPTPALVALVSLAVLVSSLALFVLRHRAASLSKAPVAAGPGGGSKYQPLATKDVAAVAATNGEERKGEGDKAERDDSKVAIGILFGTQTGTSEGFAKTLVSELQHHFASHCTVELSSLDDLAEDSDGFTAKLKAFHATFFLVATYGDGEPTDDAQRFFKWLHATAAHAEAQDDSPVPLQGLRFAVFGLGNRQYEHFNLMGKMLDKHLAALGGQRVAEVGLGDDDQCIEDDFKAWRAGLWKGFEAPVLLPAFIRSSHFRPPTDPTRPIVMVGPGTGLAPFRAFLQHRALLQKGGQQLGEALLFFGCRHRHQDYIYREELAAYEESGVLSALHVAFSRDGPSKVYVQHLLKQQAERVWQVVGRRGGSVYVCGDAKAMARDVHHALLEVAVEQGKMAKEAAVALLDGLAEQGRYLRDIW